MPFDSIEFMSPSRRILLAAADLIERRGLAKGTQEDGKGRLCLHGAISIAATGRPYDDTPESCRACDAIWRYLVARGVYDEAWPPHGCASWNNKPERTQAEVVAALRGAVAYVEEPAFSP